MSEIIIWVEAISWLIIMSTSTVFGYYLGLKIRDTLVRWGMG